MGEAKRRQESKARAYNTRIATIPMPPQIAALPVTETGYPTPWFAAWMDEAGREAPPGQGTPDLRVVGRGRIGQAIREARCWVCGGRLRDGPMAAVIGPMCTINRVSSEPPSHLTCARYAARACPFLSRPRMRRNLHDFPEEATFTPGLAIDRNPGVAAVWQTHQVTYQPDVGLFDVGDPVGVEWWAEGRPATRDEVLASIDSGLPLLLAACEEDTDPAGAREALMGQLQQAMRLVPEASA